jgi:hypothetical protein
MSNVSLDKQEFRVIPDLFKATFYNLSSCSQYLSLPTRTNLSVFLSIRRPTDVYAIDFRGLSCVPTYVHLSVCQPCATGVPACLSAYVMYDCLLHAYTHLVQFHFYSYFKRDIIVLKNAHCR